MKLWPSLILSLAASASLLAQSPTPAPSPSPGAKPQPSPSAKPGSGKKTGKPAASAPDEDERIKAVLQGIPAAQVFQGMKIPNFGPDGKLQSLFSADTAKRIADREIEMQNLKIEIHNDDGTTFHVEMAHSVFNFDTKILTSDTPTTIKRDDMIINGDRAQFHVKTRFGRVMGNVKMVIFNTGNTDVAPQGSKKPTPTPTPTTKK